MEIVFLDQNKWIELARVESRRSCSSQLLRLHDELANGVEAGRVVFPLTVANILETSKRNDMESRTHVAVLQARLSRGWVFRSRRARLRTEMHTALRQIFEHLPPNLDKNWAIGPGFLQAFEQFDELNGSGVDAVRALRMNVLMDPQLQYLDYMLKQNDGLRRQANEMLATESSKLLSNMEERRKLLIGETVDLRRRAYAARLFLDHEELIHEALYNVERTFEDLVAIGPNAVVDFFRSIPTLWVESELAARLEAQPGHLKANDIRDMASFCAALPYADTIVGERVFVSLAAQAKLDKRYNTTLHTNIKGLQGAYS